MVTVFLAIGAIFKSTLLKIPLNITLFYGVYKKCYMLSWLLTGIQIHVEHTSM